MSTALTAEQLAAMVAFREMEGRAWRRRLGELWEFSDSYHHNAQTSRVLRGLRNTHGPSWLVHFKFPAVSK